MGISTIERYERKTEFLVDKASPEVIERRRKFARKLRKRKDKRIKKEAFAEGLKSRTTLAEKILASALSSTTYHINKKSGKINFLKFRTQEVIMGYIADFVFPKPKIIVEVDGGYHKERTEYDLRRDIALQEAGWTTLRFTNEQIISDAKGIAAELSSICRRLCKAQWRTK
jgi:very-short-patch-repair endonuclease